jgi:hypothetical protein
LGEREIGENINNKVQIHGKKREIGDRATYREGKW